MAAYQASSESVEWMRAELQLAKTIESSGRSDVPEAIGGPLMQLVRSENQEADQHAIDPIAEPALAALLTLAVADLLPAHAQAVLYAPFAVTIPRHELA